MNDATLKLEPHEGGVTLSLEVRELSALERLQFIAASMCACVSGRARVRIPHARTFLRGRPLRGARPFRSRAGDALDASLAPVTPQRL